MLELDKSHAALLVMDFQAPIVEMLGDAAKPLLERSKSVITKARAAKIPVIYVVIGFRPGYPEMSSRNSAAANIARLGGLAGIPGADIPEALRPLPEEIIVVKHRTSAFSGSDLEMILRARQIETLILMGVATSGVVLSTLRQAADWDFKQVVVKDCCADRDEEVHRVLTEKVFVRQATVTTADELCAALGE